jgi:hypothetical protein
MTQSRWFIAIDMITCAIICTLVIGFTSHLTLQAYAAVLTIEVLAARFLRTMRERERRQQLSFVETKHYMDGLIKRNVQ